MDFSARRVYQSFLNMIDMTGGNKALSQEDKARVETIRDMMSGRLDTPRDMMSGLLDTPEPEPEPEMTEPGLGTLGDERVDRKGQAAEAAA